MKAVIGLGNPGREYAESRHNVGARVLDVLAEEKGLVFRKKRTVRSLCCETHGEGYVVALVKPLTYMNLSGRAVLAVVTEYELLPCDIVVVCDDINLDTGRIRIRRHGGDGGHNGLRSIIEALNTEAFPRLRVGIGRIGARNGDLTPHVLGYFEEEEKRLIEPSIRKAARAVEDIMEKGLGFAMNTYNPVGKESHPEPDGGDDASAQKA